MKLCKQILSILIVILMFAMFNVSIYLLVTVKCVNDLSPENQAKAITVEDYLPHTEESGIVKTDASLKITDDIPVLDGAAALLPVFSAFANAVYPSGSCEYDGEDYTHESKLQYTNTIGSYKAIVDGDADIIFCASPSDEQLAYAEENGVDLVFVPIGYEAFVFFVNKNNPIDSLTVDEIRGIYSGKYTNWSMFGGENRIINPLTRRSGSGSQSKMDSFMNGEEIHKSPFVLFGSSIGFSFRYYVEGIVNNGNIKMLSVNGVYPNKENIINGSYPIVSEFYAVYRSYDDNENVEKMIDWILSEEGQYIINESGYVGIK